MGCCLEDAQVSATKAPKPLPSSDILAGNMRYVQYRDQQLEAMVANSKREDPNILCPEGNKVTKVCMNPKCKIALRCDSLTSFKEITQQLNSKTEQCRTILPGILKIESQKIREKQREARQFQIKYVVGQLSSVSQQLLKKIYIDESYKSIEGKEVIELCQDLQGKILKEDIFQKINYSYFDELKKLQKNIRLLKDECFIDQWKTQSIKEQIVNQRKDVNFDKVIPIKADPQLYKEFTLDNAGGWPNPSACCPEGKKVVKACTNPDCLQALRCGDNTCSSCGKQFHPRCLPMQLNEVNQLMNLRIKEFRELLEKGVKQDEQFYKNVMNESQQFMARFIGGSLSVQALKKIKAIYLLKQYQCLSGEQALNLCRQLQSQSSITAQQAQLRLELYSCSLQNKTNLHLKEASFFRLKTSTFFGGMLNSGLSDSVVLQRKGNQEEDMDYIKKILKQPYSINLIFRASKHSFSAARFHDYCDDLNDTLILIRTEFGKTILGFSHYKWNEKNINKDGYFISQNISADNSFLVQLDRKEKLSIAPSNSCLIRCLKDSGPIFGQDALIIGNNCHANPSCKVNRLGDSFDSPFKPNWYKKNDHRVSQIFSGANINGTFRIDDYQVFQVNWK